MKTIAFFNNKGGVGKTSLTYHLAWMFADLDKRVIVADFDPQANLSSMFLPEERLEELWSDEEHPDTILGTITPILIGTGDIKDPHVEHVADNIGLLVGDLGLSCFEDDLASNWPGCLDGKVKNFRIISAFYRMVKQAAEQQKADLVLIDVGPNLGAINRSAILAAEHIVIPLAPDLFSLQGLKNLGPSLEQWRDGWSERHKKNPDENLPLPPMTDHMSPLGYVVLRHAMQTTNRPIKAYDRWMNKIPNVYRKYISHEEERSIRVQEDPCCLASLKHYRSLMPLAMEARKPMFYLKPADGAIGAHVAAVKSCYEDFKLLAEKILQASG